MTDDDALFFGDIMSTAYFCAENGGIRPGDIVAEFGAEPVDVDKGGPAEQLRKLTGRRGPDVVLGCVGHETPFTMPLPDTPHSYAIFDRKEDRAIKVMLKP